jgi:tetratricopeptide (TPR) repeat protein
MNFERFLNMTTSALLVSLFLSSVPDPVVAASPDCNCARQKTETAEKASSRTEKRRLSLDGIACADACLKSDPNDSACYYYRGINRGHLLETMLANPKTHIPKMVDDFKKAAATAPAYDGAGAPRALGYVYLQLPPISLWGAEYKRDVTRAASYSEQALRLAPEEPDNLKLAGEVAVARKDFKTASGYFEKALEEFKKKPDAARGDIVTETEKLLKDSREKVSSKSG